MQAPTALTLQPVERLTREDRYQIFLSFKIYFQMYRRWAFSQVGPALFLHCKKP